MRPIWSGAISFGLIHIPVKLYSGSREKQVSLHYVRKTDLCPIKYVKVCKSTGEEVPFKDLAKGYEYEKGDYIVLEDDDFKRANIEKYQTIQVIEFLKKDEINPDYYEKPYFLEPTKEAAGAYVLLREAMRRTGKMALAKFMLRDKEHLAVLRPDENAITLNQLRFTDEINPKHELKVPEQPNIKKGELEMAIKLIDQLSGAFNAEEYKDTYEQQLETIINKKLSGKLPDKIKATKYPIGDIMEQLKKSLEEAKAS